MIRRGHIDGGHQEPDAGPFIEGPHIHYPTSVFSDIGNRGRSRVYAWSINRDVSLKEVVMRFVRDLNISGQPEEQPLLLEDS